MMGISMARRLLNAGHELAVWNRSAGKAAALVEAGAKLAPYSRSIAESVSIVLQLLVPRMVQGIYSPPPSHIATMLTDLDTVADVAQTTSTPVPMATLAGQIFRLGKAARGADVDALEIYKLYAKAG